MENPEIYENPVILVDLDEVLADFVGAACTVHRWSRTEIQQLRSDVGWDMAAIVGMSQEEFWRPIHRAGTAFWTSIKPLPWFNELVAMLDRFDWYIVSSPARGVSSRIGKYLWIDTWLPRMLDRTILTSAKHLLAGQGKILIDDRPQSVESFIRHGGHGILFPSFGNVLARMSHDPIPYIEEQLHALSLS